MNTDCDMQAPGYPFVTCKWRFGMSIFLLPRSCVLLVPISGLGANVQKAKSC